MLVILALLSARAAELQVRALDGHTVELQNSAVLFWSMDDSGLGRTVDTAARAGLAVVLVNTDAASERSQIGSFLAREGVRAPVVADPDGGLARRLGAPAGLSVVVLDDDGAVAARLPVNGSSVAEFRSICATFGDTRRTADITPR